MLAANRRLQGILIAALFILVMLGSLMPDPFRTISSNANLHAANKTKIETIRDYFRDNTHYVALAPLLRGIMGRAVASSLSHQVYIGRNDHLYYAGEQAAAQSAGAIYRRPEVLHFAEMAATLQRRLSRDGAKLIVAIPPNAQSVAVEDLPWHGTKQRPLEYDLALDELRKRGVHQVDLKAALLAQGNGNAVYRRTDSHWNMLGAALSFDSVVIDAGHPEWKVDANAVVGPVTPVQAGDLARFMGIEKYLPDAAPSLTLVPDTSWEKVEILRTPPYAGVFESYAYEHKGAVNGERVLVLGDSFTKDFWLPLFQHTNIERIGWLHHGVCGFDFAAIERFEPTLVILAPTERLMPCALAQWPSGLERSRGRADISN